MITLYGLFLKIKENFLMIKSAALLFSLTAMSTVSFGLTLHSMTPAQMSKAFVNMTATSVPAVNLNDKSINDTVTVYLDDKGHVFGSMAQKPPEGPQKDEGTYKIKPDGSMQITWQHWDHAKTFDAYFFDTKNAYVVIDNNKAFHTVFMKSQMQSGNHVK
jgi:hypothetical protein